MRELAKSRDAGTDRAANFGPVTNEGFAAEARLPANAVDQLDHRCCPILAGRLDQGSERLCSRRTARLLDPSVIRAWNMPLTPIFAPLRGGPAFSLTTVIVPVPSFT